MKLFKFLTVIIIVVVMFFASFPLVVDSSTEFISDVDYDKTYDIELYTNNTNITILSSSNQDIEIYNSASKIRELISPTYYYIEDNTFYIKNSEFDQFNGNTQTELTIFIPEDMIINDIDYYGLNNNINIDSLSFNDINVEGDNINLVISNSNFNNYSSNTSELNMYISDTSFNNLDSNSRAGLAKFYNTISRGDMNINYESKGTVYLHDMVSNEIKINGSVDLDIQLLLGQNYDIKTDNDVRHQNVTETTFGYQYIGDSEKDYVTTIDLSDALVDDINFNIK